VRGELRRFLFLDLLQRVVRVRTAFARLSSTPDFSIATMVFSKVGSSAALAIASISAICCFMPSSIAGWKSASTILSNGGAWKGSVLWVSRGFTCETCALGAVPGVAGAVPGAAGAGAAFSVSFDEEQAAVRAIDVSIASRRSFGTGLSP